jgi:DNA repair exonuclease SbcCD nuclease subunit
VTAFRFIHAADIHLDSPLRGLAGQEGATSRRIQTAPRAALENLVALAIDENVDFVVIAGDLYDGDWRDFHTGLFFVSQVGRLATAGIPTFVLHGNHDAESRITRRLTLPDEVRVFDARRPVTFQLDHLEVALHGQSFRQRDVSDNLALDYPAPVDGCFNIGVLHTGLGGLGGHQNYAPCTLDDLISRGYDYWALGHVHQHTVLGSRPHVVFPGNLQGRHIRETGPKGACLVTVEEREVTSLRHVAVDAVRWAHLAVSVDDCERLPDVTEALRRAVEAAVRDEADGRLLACRLDLVGNTKLHGELLAAQEQILAEARAAALSLGDEGAWIEKVRIETVPQVSQAVLSARQDALGQLLRDLDHAAADAAFLDVLANEIGQFARRLPPEIRSQAEDPVLRAAIDEDQHSLLRALRAELSSRVHDEAG